MKKHLMLLLVVCGTVLAQPSDWLGQVSTTYVTGRTNCYGRTNVQPTGEVGLALGRKVGRGNSVVFGATGVVAGQAEYAAYVSARFGLDRYCRSNVGFSLKGLGNTQVLKGRRTDAVELGIGADYQVTPRVVASAWARWTQPTGSQHGVFTPVWGVSYTAPLARRWEANLVYRAGWTEGGWDLSKVSIAWRPSKGEKFSVYGEYTTHWRVSDGVNRLAAGIKYDHNF